MSLAELQRQLLIEVGRLLKPKGYALKVNDWAFHLRNEWGRWQLHLAFIMHPPRDFDVVARVAIRFDAVEDLRHMGDDRLTKADRRRSATIGSELGNIAGSGQMRWTVAGPGDVPRVALEIMNAFERIGLPYLERYATPAAALQKLASDDADVWLLMPFEATRWQNAVALAYLFGMRDRVGELVARAETRLKRADPLAQQQFRQFVADLKAEGGGTLSP